MSISVERRNPVRAEQKRVRVSLKIVDSEGRYEKNKKKEKS